MLNISYDDFDTVCYNLQHNIIELIEHVIGISLEVNINIGNVQNLQQLVDSLNAQVQNMQGQIGPGNVNNSIISINNSITRIDNEISNIKAWMTGTDLEITYLKQRVTALENKP